MSLKRISLVISLSIALSFSPTPASANVPGGGDGKGPDVTVMDNGDGTVTMGNGIVSIVIVKATSGAMGGSKSEEFLAKAAVGEDTYVRCTHCDYAANVEAVAVRAPAEVSYADARAAHAEDTPATPTIDSSSPRQPPRFFKSPASRADELRLTSPARSNSTATASGVPKSSSIAALNRAA